MRLDYSAIEIIKEILAVREISINDLCEKLSISRRTFYYRLDKINDWLTKNGFDEVHNRRSLGVALLEAEKPLIQERLAGMTASVYELSGEERRCNILLRLSTARGDVFIQTFNAINKVSRNTTLEDLHRVGQEISRRDGVEVCFLKKSGYFIDGPTLKKRLCLLYFLQRGLKYKNHFLENAVARILDENVHETHRTAAELSLLVADLIQEAQRRLDRNFTDKDRRLLRYALLLSCVDIAAGGEVSFDAQQRTYLRDVPEFDAGRRIRAMIEESLGREIGLDEDYFLALLLLSAKSHVLTPGTGREDRRLVEAIVQMVDIFQEVSGFTCHDLEGLVARLFSHLRPAIHRCLFSIHLDNVLRDDIAQKYPRLLETTRHAVVALEKEYGIRLSEDELGYIAILFGSRLTPEELRPERRVLLVTEGGISTTTLLERQLRELTILPLDLCSCSMSEFLAAACPTDVDVIVTTADLPIGSHHDVPSVKVRHILNTSEQYLVRGLIEGTRNDPRIRTMVASIMEVVGNDLTPERSMAVSAQITAIVDHFVAGRP